MGSSLKLFLIPLASLFFASLCSQLPRFQLLLLFTYVPSLLKLHSVWGTRLKVLCVFMKSEHLMQVPL